MKRKIFIALLLIPLFILASVKPIYGQEWTEPVNISNGNKQSMDIDMMIDHDGVIHVVWDSRIENDIVHWLILHSYSQDDGTTWSEPTDILQNTEYWMAQPHIACDSKNNLYVCYTHDYLRVSPEDRVIKMTIFDGFNWSAPFLISKELPGSHYPKVVVNPVDELYVFWGYMSYEFYYKYFQNNHWSDTYCLYCDLDDLYYVSEGILVTKEFINLAGSSVSNNYYGERLQYYKYDFFGNSWSSPQLISKDTVMVDIDLDIDSKGILEVAYRKISEATDSTMYTTQEYNHWKKPNLVSGINKRQIGQQIAIDQNNDVHILETEYNHPGPYDTQLIHYYQNENSWDSQIIDTSDNLCNFPKLVYHDKTLYVAYYKTGISFSSNKDIWFSKLDVTTTNISITTNHIEVLKTYPNPSTGNLTIEFENDKQQHINISIFDINGKLIKTLIDKKIPQGLQKVFWDGTMQNGKKVKGGSYLVRLQAGNKSQTQTVEIIR